MSRVLKKSGFTSENKCHKTPESQIQKSYNIKNLVDWGEISTTQEDLLSLLLHSLTKPGQTLGIHGCQLA